MPAPMISALDVVKTYAIGGSEFRALDGLNFEIDRGEFAVVLGPSGAGKTTILNLVGGMDSLSGGELYADGVDLGRLTKRELTAYRRCDVGFVFQFYNLMPNLNALENVEFAAEMSKNAFSPREILERVGLGERLRHFPAQLSGGEQQRVSIARALAKNPKILLCDEPTGALDYATGKSVLGLLHNMCRAQNKTVVVVTHNAALQEMADKVVFVKNGKAEKVIRNSSPRDIAEIEW